jgi:hypothetical protein
MDPQPLRPWLLPADAETVCFANEQHAVCCVFSAGKLQAAQTFAGNDANSNVKAQQQGNNNKDDESSPSWRSGGAA